MRADRDREVVEHAEARAFGMERVVRAARQIAAEPGGQRIGGRRQRAADRRERAPHQLLATTGIRCGA